MQLSAGGLLGTEVRKTAGLVQRVEKQQKWFKKRTQDVIHNDLTAAEPCNDDISWKMHN
jgi:hypothetical protein